MFSRNHLLALATIAWLTMPCGLALAADGFADSITTADAVARANDHAPLRLTRPDGQRKPTSNAANHGAAGESDRQSRSNSSWWTSVGGLSLVVIAIVLSARFLRRWLPKTPGLLPDQALEMLGRFPVDPRNNIYLVRCGRRLLVLGAAADGLRTLSEITDVGEVSALMRLCADGQEIEPGIERPVLSTEYSVPSTQPSTLPSAAQRLQDRLRKSASLTSTPENSPASPREVSHG
ncbi:MAG: FliO/MopB family protein [Planctomycetales bacterium]|nr:FliO/MopB family protein [Planctomycetales bacterium]